MSDQHNRTNGCDDENDEVHALRQVKLPRSELESLAKNRKDLKRFEEKSPVDRRRERGKEEEKKRS